MSSYFFIIGAQRCGTTYLYHQLDAHPGIEMAKPMRPEPKFFFTDELFNLGLDQYERRFFSAEASALVRGEKSTVYYESVPAAKRIAGSFDQPRVIMVIRDPVERAVSNYWFSVNNGLETLPIEEAFRSEESRANDYDKTQISVNPFAYLRRGRYIDFVDIYDRYFPPERFEIVIFEQFISDPSVLRGIYAFLGVDSDFAPPHPERVINASENTDTQVISSNLRAWMADYYQECNRRLARRLGRSLEIWPCVE